MYPKREFSTSDIVWLCKSLGKLGVEFWLDGGWAVDALVGRQTRPHEDVDIVIHEKDVKKIRSFLTREGFVDIPRDDTRPWNFVLGDKKGRLIDIHVIKLDEKGNGIYGPIENNQMYEAEALTGKGQINDIEVKCIHPKYLLGYHSGYKLRAKDHHDIKILKTLLTQS